MIELNEVSKSFGTSSVLETVDLCVGEGEIMVLLGPSGCGKTTLLRLLAGLERPDSGSIRIGSALVASDDSWVPPERRNVGLVFQDWALFPHLSVKHNIGFGLAKSQDSTKVVAQMLDLVGLNGLGDRMPATLSGGQQQRVALARSLAPSPRVLLLDEPFSNLDATLRDQLRAELRILLGELSMTAVFVTHDQGEALELGDRVAIIDQGSIVVCSDPATIYNRPVSAWAARLVGDANLIDITALGVSAQSAIGNLTLSEPMSGRAVALIRPEDLGLVHGGEATVREVRYRGPETMYKVELGASLYLIRAGGSPALEVGERATIECLSNSLWAFPR